MVDRPRSGVDDQLVEELDCDGFSIRREVVPRELVDRMRADVDEALLAERTQFPPGDDQYGRLLFAASHGASFLDFVACEPVFGPLEELLGPDSILYTYTTSVLLPGEAGPVSEYHDDFDPGRSRTRLALGAIVMIDAFSSASGATEVLPGSHRRTSRTDPAPWEPSQPQLLIGAPGDVCFFDPRTLHRTTRNVSPGPRRSVLVLLVRPWIKQRFDVRQMLGDALLGSCDPVVSRRLGSASFPALSADEFLARRG